MGEGVTDELLLKEAQKAIHGSLPGKKRHFYLYGAFWTTVGAALTGLAWLLSWLL